MITPTNEEESAIMARNRRAILDAALVLMAERGFAAASMRDLAATSGMNVAIIYRLFASKDDILEAVIDERRVRVFEGPAPVARAATDEETLARLFAELLDRDVEYEQIYRIMFGLDARDHPHVVALRTEVWQSTEKAYVRWLVELFPHLRGRKELRAIARTIRTLVQGAYGELILAPGNRRRAARARAKELAAVVAPVLGPT